MEIRPAKKLGIDFTSAFPNKILFMDDSIDQLKSVESVSHFLGIEFIGFHYTASETNSYEFDQELGEFQFQNLVYNEQWLPDTEARKALKQETCD